jgi:hypothetical protein
LVEYLHVNLHALGFDDCVFDTKTKKLRKETPADNSFDGP